MQEWWNESPYQPKDITTEQPTPEQPSAPSEPAPTPAPATPPPAQPVPPANGWGDMNTPQPSGQPFTPPQNGQPSGQPFVPPPPFGTAPNGQKPPRKKQNGIMIAFVAVMSVLCIGCLGIGVSLLTEEDGGDTSSGPSISTSGDEQSGGDGTGGDKTPSVNIQNTEIKDGGLTTREIVDNNLDSTVVINMYKNATAQYGNFTFGTENEETVAGTGSGIIMSEDGYIITNEHVVIDESTAEPYSRIEVVLYSGATYSATVVGADEDTDLAVIKVDATGLKAAKFGTSADMHIGDRVVTLGNAGGLEWSASEGILSGKNRDVYDETGYAIQCLQIDAAINPGNSGGPLLNCMGEVIGINSAKIVYSGFESIGFSIPITEAKPVLDDLIAHGHVTGRVGLGITGYTITQRGYEGFMIYTIEAGSSLEGTVVQQHDIITHIDDVRVSSRTELRKQLSQKNVGDTVNLKILRITNQRTGETTELTVAVTLKEAQ